MQRPRPTEARDIGAADLDELLGEVGGLSRSLWLGGSAPVVEADGPEVGHDGNADAPGDGGDGVAANGGAAEQSAHGVGDGGEGLVLGELAQARWHGGRGHEAAAKEQQQEQDHRGVAGGLDALGGKPQRDGQPDQREGEQGQYPDRGHPVQRSGSRAESEAEGDPDEDGDGYEGLDQAAEYVPGEDRGAGDGHGAEP